MRIASVAARFSRCGRLTVPRADDTRSTRAENSPGRTAADPPVAAAVQPNATERLPPAKVEPATRSREKVTAKRYALTKPAANEHGSRPLFLVGAGFIIGEASDPGFPQPIGTAVRLAGQAV